MEGLFQPSHLLFVLLIVLIIFGPGKLPENFGEGLRRALLDLRGEWNGFRGALFMAKGVDPSIGRDVGDMLPDEEVRRGKHWFLLLVSILVGNTLYLLSSQFLPAAARIDALPNSGLPALVALWYCFLVFGLLNLAALLRRRNPPKD